MWAIPLHNGTLSVGIAARQDFFFARKKSTGLEGKAFYQDYLKLVPQIYALLSDAEIVSDLKQASDWSYSASAYAGPHFRIAGDAGCFVDPYFSSGVHLALNSGLAAATSIQAARRGQADERRAAKWHSTKVAEGYTRFLLLVMTVLRQVRLKDADLITTEEEEGFDRAFDKIRPVIQGVADTETEDERIQKGAAESVDFALSSFEITPEKQRSVIDKIERAQAAPEMLEKLTLEEVHILDNVVMRAFDKKDEALSLSSFAGEVIDGISANLVHGDLGFIERYAEPAANLAGPATKMEAPALDRNIKQAA